MGFIVSEYVEGMNWQSAKCCCTPYIVMRCGGNSKVSGVMVVVVAWQNGVASEVWLAPSPSHVVYPMVSIVMPEAHSVNRGRNVKSLN